MLWLLFSCQRAQLLMSSDTVTRSMRCKRGYPTKVSNSLQSSWTHQFSIYSGCATTPYACLRFVRCSNLQGSVSMSISSESLLAHRIDKQLTQITTSHNHRHAWCTNSLIWNGLMLSHRNVHLISVMTYFEATFWDQTPSTISSLDPCPDGWSCPCESGCTLYGASSTFPLVCAHPKAALRSSTSSLQSAAASCTINAMQHVSQPWASEYGKAHRLPNAVLQQQWH